MTSSLFDRIRDLCQDIPHHPLALGFAINDTLLGGAFPVGVSGQHVVVMLEKSWCSITTGQPAEKPTQAFKSIYHAVDEKVLSYHDLGVYSRLCEKISILGAGLRFYTTTNVNPQLLSEALKRFGCHPSVGLSIAQDLNTTGMRACTVKSHIGKQWAVLGKQLSSLGVSVHPVAPKVGPDTLPLDLKLRQLARKFS